MDLQEALKRRRTCREFLPADIPDNILDQLVYAANRAPTGGNVSTRTLILVKDRRIIHKMKLLSPGFGGFPRVVIVICTDTAIKQDSNLASFDSGAAAENVALTATALGLGVGFVKSYPEEPIKKLLHLPENMKTEIAITLGYSVRKQAPAPKAPETKIFVDHYEQTIPTKTENTADPHYGALFEAALYALVSARTVIDEPSRYGPRRLMDTVERILAVQETEDNRANRDPFLAEILDELRRRTDMQFSSVIYSKEFRTYLDDLIGKFVEEMEHRDLSPKGTR